MTTTLEAANKQARRELVEQADGPGKKMRQAVTKRQGRADAQAGKRAVVEASKAETQAQADRWAGRQAGRQRL